jgi:uncharacterized protein (TIGR03435 family)
MTRIVLFVLAALSATAMPADRPTFDVASIRAGQQGRESIEVVPGSVTLRNARLTACIRWAYNLPEFQISGPDWMNEVWFDINAKAAGPAKEAELRLMLQNLLADRFKLTLHRQTKEVSAMVLTVGKGGHKLKPVETEEPPSFKTGKLNLTGKGATMDQLVQFISRELRNPVVDQTGLTGRFDYFLDIAPYFTEEMLRAGGPGGGPPPDAAGIVAQAIQAQLGLKVESKKVPVEMLVIDRIEKAPTEN